ncbi:MAG: 16S rRNA (adenine(1518)-N(6)/adenine(1519)-N(6))-dimethyltransferase RsmA [Patescibacteria group bacterium]|jgi:16S rRNA (adenine1518-N6/adenine1519-N6)-dimethyltransferase
MSDLLSQIREICRLMEIKPSRSKGQNFLINEKIYEEIVTAANLQPTDTVLEIGPGLGFLTIKLAQKAQRIVAVELDDNLANYLKMAVDANNTANLEIVNGDILRFNPRAHQLETGKYKIVANLPYNITSIFLRRFLSGESRPKSLILMLQKEVAERITAQPPDMSILAISVQYYATAEIIKIVKAGNFWPEPKVDSALVKLTLINKEYISTEDKRFFRVVRIGFSSKRKMLKNNLAAGLKTETKIMENLLVSQGLNPQVRAEDLSLENWRNLFAALTSFVV